MAELLKDHFKLFWTNEEGDDEFHDMHDDIPKRKLKYLIEKFCALETFYFTV